MRHPDRAVVAAVAVIGLIGGCMPPPSAPPPGNATITVFAAASLRKAFSEIGERYTSDNPGSEVEFSFAGSADLLTALTQGAAADVFAAADGATMDKAAQAGLLAGDPHNFASNRLTIAVAPGNPRKIASLRDLTRPGLAVVACAPQVPCGAAARRVEQAAGVELQPVSEESQVTDVLGKVVTGQADAGLVYVTDVLAAGGKVTAVAFPESAGAVNSYPIAVLAQSGNPGAARDFIEWVSSDAGRKILSANGFGTP